MLGAEAILLHGNTAALHAVTLRDAEEDEVTRVFDQHDVARIAEALRKHVEKLLRTAADQDPLGGVNAGVIVPIQQSQIVRSEASQACVAASASILESVSACLRVGQNLFQHAESLANGKRFAVRESSREGDESRMIECQLHQPGDRRIGGALS